MGEGVSVGKPMLMSYDDVTSYMSLITMMMLDNKILYNESADPERRAYLKQRNDELAETWIRLNKQLGAAQGFIEVFNATKQREVNGLRC